MREFRAFSNQCWRRRAQVIRVAALTIEILLGFGLLAGIGIQSAVQSLPEGCQGVCGCIQ